MKKLNKLQKAFIDALREKKEEQDKLQEKKLEKISENKNQNPKTDAWL